MEALAIRPSGGDRIRNWIQVLLREQGVALKTDPNLNDGIAEPQILQTLRALRADVLLLPFLSARTSAARPSNGLVLLDQIRREVPWARRTPVILQVGIFAVTAFNASFQGRSVESLFVLFEDELAADGTPGKLGVWLRALAAHFRHFTSAA